MKTEEFLQHEISRRQFLGSSAVNAAGVAVGMVGVGLAESASKGAASERVRLGIIGVRTQGRELARAFAQLRDAEIVALCDVDEGVLRAAAKSVEETAQRRPRLVRDFRRLLDDPLIDAVAIATPDHWHAVMSVTAFQAGKDVYLEAPISHTFAEGQHILQAGRRWRRIVQSGLQQRAGLHFQSAIDTVRSGQLGAVRLARAWCVHRRKPIGFKTAVPTPPDVNYDLWLGPAAARPFHPNRFHHNWHWYWDYGTGELGNWGVHFLDVARWGLGVELPVRIASTGGIYFLKDDRETPDTQIVQYSYPGKTILWEHRMWSPHGMEGRSAACAFYGEHGTLIVDRGGWKIYGRKEAAAAGKSELLSRHCRNFIDCVKSRRAPLADARCGHVSTSLCHLGNIAHRVSRELRFDPEQGRFERDNEADRLLARSEHRSPWTLPKVPTE